jgi:hypothetical protein
MNAEVNVIAVDSAIIANNGNSDTLGVGVGETEIEIAGMVIVWMLLQSPGPPLNTYGYIL